MSEISFPSHFSLNTHLSERPVQALLNNFTCTDWTRAWFSKGMHHFLMPHFPEWMTGMDPRLRERGEGFKWGSCFRLREPGFGFGLLVMKPCDVPLPKCNWSLRTFRLSARFYWDKSQHWSERKSRLLDYAQPSGVFNLSAWEWLRILIIRKDSLYHAELQIRYLNTSASFSPQSYGYTHQGLLLISISFWSRWSGFFYLWLCLKYA